MEASTDWQQVKASFKKIWGYDDFRPPQGEIIKSLLDKKDALIVMPTGGGKSICFQLPALLQTGLTLIISPLVALMENQVQELQELQLPAALIHSQLMPQQRRKTLSLVQQNQLRLLYLSPETLLSSPVWSVISQPHVQINGLILDEAHCLVQWGDTFRPAYRRLGAIRSTLLKLKPKGTKIAIAAFTATANPDAQDTIKQVLQLQKPQQFLLSPYRSNLELNIKTVCTPKGRQQQLIQFIQSRKNQTGLIYARTRKDCEQLAQWLQTENYSTVAYHAGLSSEERRKIEKDWLQEKIKFVVCSSAFGMGINKSNVRWVCHFQAPFLLSEYIQEVGRAGRDGKPAIALTIISELTGFFYPEDKQRQKYLIENLEKQYQSANQLIKKLPATGNIETLSEQFKNSAIALSILHAQGRLIWHNPFDYEILSKPAKLNQDQNSKAIQQMNQYLKTRDCRWKFLLQSFGFNLDNQFKRCGHCDRCKSSR
ncbi:RecQ family ATP-dependent DNA helicase [Planktothrix agardhii]|jgi:ATP-dependent DNA helicase RecQ|uniref:ATP-dependent DNA helicase RecQ n=2 Tax=Planktothrix agardhii TaxID=1160 RepID=A0A073CVA4_PLAA1|nr:RecQ family ATP-dependent DNA helicase [Planktothrix agardhii]MCF3606367.1 RecQ family ATP-dependent DNA helicase [Planktothrix agardhii 1033]CAH2570673.1 ATP-dependent DNA helicase RecQ [Planktothrix rubescens]BBD56258.1 ATP-dependent DNA helicase RecQ [Planktothrix agardhii NIES-204]KEI67925.1 RecQ [Planktothrix agardhii NIVA-CYA 126/8]MBG0746398.1 ATP-dependent DNA helicase RecQ [Planktothrix agardhii KL2]